MAKEIKTKAVAFNVVDPFQKRLLEHTKQFTNFSSYIKSLIQRDMEGGRFQPIPVEPSVDKSFMNQLL